MTPIVRRRVPRQLTPTETQSKQVNLGWKFYYSKCQRWSISQWQLCLFEGLELNIVISHCFTSSRIRNVRFMRDIQKYNNCNNNNAFCALIIRFPRMRKNHAKKAQHKISDWKQSLVQRTRWKIMFWAKKSWTVALSLSPADTNGKWLSWTKNPDGSRHSLRRKTNRLSNLWTRQWMRSNRARQGKIASQMRLRRCDGDGMK